MKKRTRNDAVRSIFDVTKQPVSSLQSGKTQILTGARVKTHWQVAMKKQQLRVEKAIFRLENQFFSSSIRITSVEAVLRW
jgi:hypothetical protein